MSEEIDLTKCRKCGKGMFDKEEEISMLVASVYVGTCCMNEECEFYLVLIYIG